MNLRSRYTCFFPYSWMLRIFLQNVLSNRSLAFSPPPDNDSRTHTHIHTYTITRNLSYLSTRASLQPRTLSQTLARGKSTGCPWPTALSFYHRYCLRIVEAKDCRERKRERAKNSLSMENNLQLITKYTVSIQKCWYSHHMHLSWIFNFASLSFMKQLQLRVQRAKERISEPSPSPYHFKEV